MESPCFFELINRYNKKVYTLAYHFTGNRQDAEDVVQETFLQVYKHLDDFRGDSNIYTWIYRIATNTCFRLKKQNDKAYIENLEEKINLYQDKISFQQQPKYSNPEEALLIGELTKMIRNECHQIVMHKLQISKKLFL